MNIKDIRAREILNSGATTSLEVKITLEDGTEEQASVPFGASAGSHEAFVLFDGGGRYAGKGMLKAVQNINTKIKDALIGQNAYDQAVIDQIMIDLDGTENKHRLGANAILGVSLAAARAAARSQKLEPYEYINQKLKVKSEKLKVEELPLPMIVLIEGGKHADDSTDFQEYLIVPQISESAAENIRCGAEVYLALKSVLKEKGYNTNVGNEGAFAPAGIKTNEEPWKLILEAIEKAGYKAGEEVKLAADPACSELKNSTLQACRAKFQYYLKSENRVLSSDEMINYFEQWINKYPYFISLEDILAEDDWDAWPKATKRLGQKIRIIGDDLLVTNPKRLERAIREKSCNGILIKLNQIGTVTETVKTVQMAHKAGFWTIVSHRGGGETNDASMIDLAVACGAKMVKVGIA
ncbi:MAG: phosphopyruvate hydratase, partial [Candidatus Jacksonbacteria bacterium]